MRWFWIDRFVEFESGKYAKAVKNVSLAEEHLHDHFPGFAIMPGGILLGEVNNFEHIVILAKVPNVTFHSWAVPGDSLIYTATLTDSRDEGGGVDVTAHVGDRLVAEAEIMFVHLDQKDSQFGAIDQKNFVFSMNLLGILDVGQAGDGT
jgi:3-hydroxyacyl-[acyl-carrier-protein] dehydratase